MRTVFMTGFPGFLGTQLLPRVLVRDPEMTAVCLVQERYRPQAQQRIDELDVTNEGLAKRVRLVNGDITVAGLGLAATQRDELEADAAQIFHLAAVYDLSTPRELGMRINVDGTRNMIDLAAGCSNLERFDYVSTCYVSGRYAGIFRETDLQLGQVFNNYYEETKYLAEIIVREAVAGGLPAAVYRPGIVVGDSKTGATQKYDGPYVGMQLIARQRGSVAIVPCPGDPSAFRVNVVPSDFVVDAITALSGSTDSLGRTFNLADPAPMTVKEQVELFGEKFGKRVILIPAPLGLSKAIINRGPGVEKILRVPATSLDYFTHPTHYDTALTTPVLAKLGVVCPPLRSYVDNLISFYKAHPEIGSAAMI